MNVLTDEEKALLSKHKYLYEIFFSQGYGKLDIHVEKLPIVYINRCYTYFKRHGSYSLDYAYTDKISTFEDSKDKIKRLVTMSLGTKIWTWDFNCSDRQFLNECADGCKDIQHQLKVKQLRERLAHVESHYKEILKELEELEALENG